MHSLMRECDEYFCTKCHKRWGVDEDAPTCVSEYQARRLKGLQHIQQLKRMVRDSK